MAPRDMLPTARLITSATGLYAILRAAHSRLRAVCRWLFVHPAPAISLAACLTLFLPVVYFGRSEVKDLLLISIAIGALSSLTASGVFSAYFHQTSAASRTLVAFSLTAMSAAGLIITVTQMTEWRLPSREFLTALRLTVEPGDSSIGVDESLSSRLYNGGHPGLRGSDFLFAEEGRLRRLVVTDRFPSPILTSAYVDYLEASVLTVLEIATRPHWYRPIDLLIGPAAFAVRYRYDEEPHSEPEVLLTPALLPDSLRANRFIRSNGLAISLPVDTRLRGVRLTTPEQAGALQLDHAMFFLVMRYEGLACNRGADAEVAAARAMAKIASSGKPFPSSLRVDASKLPQTVHCTGQIRIDGGTSRLWNWTERSRRYRQWIEHLAGRLQALMEAPSVTHADLAERRMEGLLKLRILNQLTAIERQLAKRGKPASQSAVEIAR